jgi:hypothetical protein
MKVILRFEDGARFSHGLVADLIDDIGRTAFRQEQAQLSRAASEFREVPTVAIDAAFNRMGQFEKSAVKVEAVRPGSLEIVLVMSALAYWLLDKTIGESFKEAWKDTSLRERLKTFLLKGKHDRANEIASSAESSVRRQTYRRYDRIEYLRTTVRTEINGEGSVVIVHIIEDRETSQIISYEDMEMGNGSEPGVTDSPGNEQR